MSKLIIDRSKWRTGNASPHPVIGPTQLLNKEGYMCCLGFYAKQIGCLTDDEIKGVRTPDDLRIRSVNPRMRNLINDDNKNSYFTDEAMSLNDSDNLDDEEREREIKLHFKRINIEVEFEGQYNQNQPNETADN
jgi:hypothetical protein